MYRIDSHHHFWTYDPTQYEWITDKMASIRRDFGPADLRKEIGAAGVSAVISVHARQDIADTRALLEFADANAFIKGVVGWVPLIQEDVRDILAKLGSNGKLRGIRHVLHDEPDPYYMLREDFNQGVTALREFGMTYDILIFERHLPQTIQFVDRHGDQIFVVDHFAKPRVAAREISPWAEQIRELAKRSHVYCKISGLVTEADYQNWTEEQLQPYFDVVLEAFTPQRLMFGSDWPVCLVATSYSNWVRIVEQFCAKLSQSEQERIWSGTAMEAYRVAE